jgi:threonine/homoserine/homoserine lactone efflux protein
METLLPLLGFVVVSTVTPGPNNLMVLVSGANWGLVRTLPHIAGIAFGFPVMIVAVGLGLGRAFESFPQLHDVLKYIAFAYLLWLAWRIANASKPEAEGGRGRPLNFFEAAAFQWVNPKAWAIVFSGIALFTTGGSAQVFQTGLIAVLFGLVCLPNGVVWTLFGSAISGLLADDTWRRRFNIAMAILLVASVVPTLF